MDRLVSAQAAASQGKLAVIFGYQPIWAFLKYDLRFDQNGKSPLRPHQPQQTFNRFSQLPKELQLLVWSHVLADYEPRPIIVKSKDKCAVKPGEQFETPMFYRAMAYWDVPSMLHVCHLSRTEALKQYSLIFHANVTDPVYFDTRKDYIIVEGQRAWESFKFHTLTYEQPFDDSPAEVREILNRNGWNDIVYL